MSSNIIDLQRFATFRRETLEEIKTTKLVEQEGTESPFSGDEIHFNITHWNLKGEKKRDSVLLKQMTK